MKRQLFKKLIAWKNRSDRKPLLLQGARQVGKTYLVKQFGKEEYKDLIYLNFEQDNELDILFSNKLEPEDLIEKISLYFGRKIVAKDTLLFFDEVQVSQRALTSLKYFMELAPQYNIIAAGSLLGVSVGKTSSFPVGKVDFLTLYPLSFREYLMANDEDLLADFLLKLKGDSSISEVIHNKLSEYFKMYLFLGGMPEVVQSYISQKDIVKTRKIQDDILASYKRDFSKYATSSQAVKNIEIWDSIPYQLAKENKKFKYSEVKQKGRSSMYDQSIEWLNSAGLVHPAYNLSAPKLPLGGYADKSKFKLYTLDTGLLGAMLRITSEIILSKSSLFQEYNGAFIENYVANALTAKGESELYYWTSRGEAEVDFVIQNNQEIIPLEIKSGSNRNLKSLQSYASKYNPKVICRSSPRNLIRSDNFINIPLYLVDRVKELV